MTSIGFGLLIGVVVILVIGRIAGALRNSFLWGWIIRYSDSDGNWKTVTVKDALPNEPEASDLPIHCRNQKEALEAAENWKKNVPGVTNVRVEHKLMRRKVAE